MTPNEKWIQARIFRNLGHASLTMCVVDLRGGGEQIASTAVTV